MEEKKIGTLGVVSFIVSWIFILGLLYMLYDWPEKNWKVVFEAKKGLITFFDKETHREDFVVRASWYPTAWIKARLQVKRRLQEAGKGDFALREIRIYDRGFAPVH